MSGITVTGRVLKTEHKAGTFTNDQGERIAYDYHLAHILTDESVVEVKFANDRPDVPIPSKGQELVVEVELPGRIKCKAVSVAVKGAGVRAAS